MPDTRLSAAMARIDSTLTAKRAERAANHSLAPVCGAFVADLRRAFGSDVTVTHVLEGDFVLGAADERVLRERGDVTVPAGKQQRETVVAQWIRF